MHKIIYKHNFAYIQWLKGDNKMSGFFKQEKSCRDLTNEEYGERLHGSHDKERELNKELEDSRSKSYQLVKEIEKARGNVGPSRLSSLLVNLSKERYKRETGQEKIKEVDEEIRQCMKDRVHRPGGPAS